MKIGITDGRRWGEEHYAKLKSFGFDCYDFNMSDTNTAPYTYDDEAFEACLKKERMLADKAGIEIWQVHGPWRCPPADATEEDRAERFEKMKRSIRGAAILGAKYWVVHPIMPFGLHDLKTGKSEQTYKENLEFMKKLLPFAKREGITICLENMPFLEFSLSSPSDIAKVVEEINDPFFAMCLDTGHVNVSKDFTTPAQVLRDFARYIKVMHVHDNDGERDLHWIPFFGTADWDDFSRALREVGYKGVFSLETSPGEKFPEDVFEYMYPMYYKVARAICT